MKESNAITLSELNLKIKEALNIMLPDAYWIIAEISEIRENLNGHCYLELVEKEDSIETITARTKAVIWSSTYRMLKPYFETGTGYTLTAGMKIMIHVSVTYHELFGLSLNIRDIEPSFSVGEIAKHRNEVRKKLQEDGVWDMNKALPTPQYPQRIAVISSPSAAGYEDFSHQLNNNRGNFKFYTKLFPAVMQGERTESSIISALDKINKHADKFDLVVIIRGGGASADLSYFDSYMLNYHCAQFPLPVISGIGHERDISILDEVAHYRAKTPTAAAEIIINLIQQSYELLMEKSAAFFESAISFFNLADNKLNSAIKDLYYITSNRIRNENVSLHILFTRIKSISENKNYVETKRILYIKEKLFSTIKQNLYQKQLSLLQIEKSMQLISPEEILKKGYSITLKDGKPVSATQLKPQDKITTVFLDGSIDSIVEKTN